MKKKFFKILLIIVCCVTLLGAVGGICYVGSIKNSEKYTKFDGGKLNKVYNNLTVLDVDGQQLNQAMYCNNIKQVPLDALPTYTSKAFVAVEDKRFFDHGGIDLRRVCGAILHNLKSGSFKEGASTISQQLIKNTHLDNQKTIERKINEMLLALELEKAFSKEQILEIYLNTIYFGRNAYGIENASNVYFDKSACDLTLSESAILAGMIKAPNTYAPDKNIEKCKNRRDLVLDLMFEQGAITEKEYTDAKNAPITFVKQKQLPEKTYMYYALKEACKILNMTEGQLLNSNYTIETFCNQKVQEQVAEIYRTDATTDKNGKLVDIACVLTNNIGEVISCYMRGDDADKVGQPGSTFKPIAVYTPALDERIISQASPVLDEPTNFNGYQPKNAGGYTGWTTIKQSVTKSLNVPAVKVLNSLTISTAEKYLQKLGIAGKQNLSLALGNVEGGVTPFELSKCYATLANGGVASDTKFVKRIVGPKGIVYQTDSCVKQVFKPTATFLMTDMLVDVVNNGTAKNLRKNYQIAAKTGTVGDKNGNSDALVAGYTTDHTFVVWYRGQFDNSMCGANAPCKMASQLLDRLYKDTSPADFVAPNGVTKLKVDKNSLESEQQLKISQQGLEFWFDNANKPTEKVEKTIYNYTIDVKNDKNGTCLQMPTVLNGQWELYEQVDGNWQKVALDNNRYCYDGKNRCTFYAKLYVNDQFVYQTPNVEVCNSCENTIREQTDKRKSWLDFWYWQ